MGKGGGGASACTRGLFALLFELVGTFILTYTIACSFNSSNSVILVMIICNLIGCRISAAHFNPAVTFASLFKRNQDRFERKAFIFYILFQFGGAFGGALFSLLEYGQAFRMLVWDDDRVF